MSLNLLDILWDYFRRPVKIPIINSQPVAMEKIRQLLSGQVWVSDGKAILVDMKSVVDFLRLNPVNRRKYITEAHDCDDFAIELMGDISDWDSSLAFGMVWGTNVDGNAHAWNFFIDNTMKLWFVEPQIDRIFEPSTEVIWLMII